MSVYRTALVKIRRGDKWVVSPGAEQLDGQKITVIHGWAITHEDSSIYGGEDAWIICRKEFHRFDNDLPSWVATGDLIFESE